MDPAFVTRSLKASAWLSGLTFLFVTYYFGYRWAIGILLGSTWGIANVMLLRALIVRTVTPHGVRWQQAAIMALIKFPLLYVAGYLIVSRPWYDVLAPVIGFTLPLLVIVLKAGGRWLIGLDGSDSSRRSFSATAGR